MLKNYLGSVLDTVVDGVKDVKVWWEVNIVGPVRLQPLLRQLNTAVPNMSAINDSRNKTSKVEF